MNTRTAGSIGSLSLLVLVLVLSPATARDPDPAAIDAILAEIFEGLVWKLNSVGE